jgi:hypothetical protein
MLAWKGLVDVRVEHSAHAVPVGMDATGNEMPLLLVRRCTIACATSSTLPSPPHTITTSNFPKSSAMMISYLYKPGHEQLKSGMLHRIRERTNDLRVCYPSRHT